MSVSHAFCQTGVSWIFWFEMNVSLGLVFSVDLLVMLLSTINPSCDGKKNYVRLLRQKEVLPR